MWRKGHAVAVVRNTCNGAEARAGVALVVAAEDLLLVTGGLLKGEEQSEDWRRYPHHHHITAGGGRRRRSSSSSLPRVSTKRDVGYSSPASPVTALLPTTLLHPHQAPRDTTAPSEMPCAARLLGLVLACLLSIALSAPTGEQQVVTSSSSNSSSVVSSSNTPTSSAVNDKSSTPVYIELTTISSESAVLHTTSVSVEQSSSLQPSTEDVFNSDEAIRHLPGYWIKRPGGAATDSHGDDHEHEGEASFIDYRTELYQIADLFANEPPSSAKHQIDTILVDHHEDEEEEEKITLCISCSEVPTGPV